MRKLWVGGKAPGDMPAKILSFGYLGDREHRQRFYGVRLSRSDIRPYRPRCGYMVRLLRNRRLIEGEDDNDRAGG